MPVDPHSAAVCVPAQSRWTSPTPRPRAARSSSRPPTTFSTGKSAGATRALRRAALQRVVLRCNVVWCRCNVWRCVASVGSALQRAGLDRTPTPSAFVGCAAPGRPSIHVAGHARGRRVCAACSAVCGAATICTAIAQGTACDRRCWRRRIRESCKRARGAPARTLARMHDECGGAQESVCMRAVALHASLADRRACGHADGAHGGAAAGWRGAA